MVKDNQNKSNSTKIVVTLPEIVTIDFVPANELRNYEIFLWLAGFVGTTAAGFWASWFTAADNRGLLWSSVILTGLSVIFVVLAFYYRGKIFNGKAQRSMRLGDFK